MLFSARILSFLLSVIFTPHTSVTKHPSQPVSISQTLAKMRNNSAYYKATVATRIESLLDGPSGRLSYPYLAVFAPTDAAMAKFKNGRFAYVFAKGQERKLGALITFPVVTDSKSLMTLHPNQILHSTYDFKTFQVVQRNGRIYLTGGTTEPIELRAKPILCDNGVIYVVDEVLLPPNWR